MTREAPSGGPDRDERLLFEAFIADCAARFSAPLPPPRIDEAIERVLDDLLHILGADRCALLGGTPGEQLAWTIAAASATGVDRAGPETDFVRAFPWHFQRLCAQGETVALATLADLPADAESDRGSALRMGIRSMLTVPSRDAGRHGGHCLLVQCLRHERDWPAYLVDRLSLLADVLANAVERRQAEAGRRTADLPDEDFLASVGAILWRADALTFQTTFVSKEAESILGYPVDAWLKLPGFWLSHVHPDDREWVQAFNARATREGRNHDFEYRMVVANGRTVWLRNIVTVRLADGEPVELVGVTVDITKRKLAEAEAARLRDQLAHANRVTSLGELAATIAHELNQPLGAIVANAEAAQLLAGRVPPSVPQLQAILSDIAADGQRAGEVLHRVRLLLHNQPLDVRPLDLAVIVEDVVRLTRPLAQSRHIELTTDAGGAELPQAQGDAIQIQQVLLNLIVNALDAAAERPRGARHVSVSAVARGAAIELLVKDSGAGVPAEVASHIFDAFVTTKPGGLGMGLAICRTIVDAHGGEISVENDAGGGATVRVSLPAYLAAGEAT